MQMSEGQGIIGVTDMLYNWKDMEGQMGTCEDI